MKNNQILDHFINNYNWTNESNKRNLHTTHNNTRLINYTSEIARKDKQGNIKINEYYNHYSNTTQKHINYLIKNGLAEIISEEDYKKLESEI